MGGRHYSNNHKIWLMYNFKSVKYKRYEGEMPLKFVIRGIIWSGKSEKVFTK